MKRESGLTTQKSKAEFSSEDSVEPILGFTDAETVKLDLDDMGFKSVKYWALKAMKKFGLNGWIVLKSSHKHYHVVFDRKITWENNLAVINWVAILSNNVSLFRYLAMQCIKKGSTLRVGAKGDKPSPRIIYRCGEQGHGIKDFLKHRELIKRIYRSMESTSYFRRENLLTALTES